MRVRAPASIPVGTPLYSGSTLRCLEENTLFGYVHNGLDITTREAVTEHAASCEACRKMIAAAVDTLPPAETDGKGRLLGGKYQLVRLLGAGGMGAVHEAINTWTGRHVAVKELIGTSSTDATAVQRFMLEARSASRIAHPNVVEVLDLGMDDSGSMFMVQELLHGCTLRQRIAERGKLSVDELLAYVRPAVSALVVAHEAGVIHRDLKPDNIFLSRDAGGNEVTKLIDFGLSKPIRTPEELDITGLGRQLGTPYYMSPEQLRSVVVDDRSDVWSMGVVMYEALTGARPFLGPTYNDLVVQILKEAVPLVTDAVPDVSPAVAAVIARSLERDVENRFTSRELQDALDELADRPGIRELPTGNPYPGLSPFGADHRGVFFGRASEVAALVKRVRDERFVLVAGDSGVGKSSLLRAGVVPAIAETGVAIAILAPGRNPLAELAAALSPIVKHPAPALVDELVTEPTRVISRLAGMRLVIFVDQLEEMLTVADPDEAEATTTVLAALLAADPTLRLTATVRSDFLARLAALPGLGDDVEDALYLLKPLSLHAVRQAILGPARITGITFESDELVDELVASRVELPLLQFALAQLWKGRDVERRMICAATLAALGGVPGALARHADGVLAELSPRQLDIARPILTLLVTSDGTRARLTEDELTPEPDDDRRAVLETLVRGRLVTVETRADGASYQIAHDFLVEGWDTLRGWRGHDIERGVARQRLSRAAGEWDRLGRPSDGLWSQRQLAEVVEVDPAALPPIEHAFLTQSRATAKRRRVVRRVIAPAILVLVALGFVVVRWTAQRRLADEIASHVEEADRMLSRAESTRDAIDEARKQVFAAFDRGDASAEDSWTGVLERQAELDIAYAQVGQQLDAALALDPRSHDARDRMAALLYDRARLAELTHQTNARDERLARMEEYDDDAIQRARWSAPARVSIASTPAARVAVRRYLDDHGRRTLEDTALDLGSTPIANTELAPGSYLIELAAPSHVPVRLPVWLSRGESLTLDVPLPANIPSGYVYVPPGRFLYGSSDTEEVRRTLMNAQPLHTVVTPGYVIGRTEVTFGDWIAFLRALPPAERTKHLPRTSETPFSHATAYVDLVETSPDKSGERPARSTAAGGAESIDKFKLTLRPTTTNYIADEGEPIRYRKRATDSPQDWSRMPVSGISWNDAVAYGSWLSRTGVLPGARPCDDHEWERAARGADERIFPHGNRLSPDDADVAATYHRVSEAFGPDEVGRHPASDSPFGVADLVGNVWELVTSVSGNERVVIRGGSWYHEALAARSNNREPNEPAFRAIVAGVRICATWNVDR